MKTMMPPKGKGRSNHFQTKNPNVAVGGLLQYIPKNMKIWCCASGAGRIVEYLKMQGYDVIGTDILSGFDFLDAMADLPKHDIIVENPPYSVKDKWLQRCFDLGKPFALLLPITALGEQKRVAMFKKYGVQLFMPKARIEFITPNGTEGGSWFYAAWFCFGLNLPNQITFE